MAQTAVEWFFEVLAHNDIIDHKKLCDDENLYNLLYSLKNQAKQMEKEQHDAWNAFLEQEKTIGISDVKTIERIQWYYNQYYNETFLKLKT
jgi:hypothetical protein